MQAPLARHESGHPAKLLSPIEFSYQSVFRINNPEYRRLQLT
jgi:hypothetical protein